MLIYWVRGWELLLECDTGQRKRHRSYGREGRGGGPMFVTSGSFTYFPLSYKLISVASDLSLVPAITMQAFIIPSV